MPEGIAVALGRTELQAPPGGPTDDWWNEVEGMLARYAALLERDDYAIGGWVDPGSGAAEINISVIFAERQNRRKPASSGLTSISRQYSNLTVNNRLLRAGRTPDEAGTAAIDWEPHHVELPWERKP